MNAAISLKPKKASTRLWLVFVMALGLLITVVMIPVCKPWWAVWDCGDIPFAAAIESTRGDIDELTSSVPSSLNPFK
jgi:hypothetical protein